MAQAGIPYQNVQGATINAFDPTQANSFLTNFNNAAPLYSTSVPNTEEQADNLTAAYQYLSDPKNQATEDAENGAGWSQYMLGQLQSDIKEQQNLVGLNQAEGTQTTASQNITQAQQLVSDIQNTQDPSKILGYAQQLQQLGVVDANTIKAMQNAYSDFGTANSPAWGTWGTTGTSVSDKLRSTFGTAINNGLTTLQTNLTNQQPGINTAENNVLQNFTLNSPDYAAAQGQIQNYYGIDANGNPIQGDTTGQVQQSQTQANQDIYQQAYQLKQQINQQANQVGATSSGERTKALGNASSQAATQAASVYEQNATAAQQAINSYNQQVQQQQAAQQAEENSVKSGTIGNLFDSGTQSNISALQQNQEQTNTTNQQSAENALKQEQQNSSLWNGIANAAGTGLGTIAAVATGGAI